LRGDHKGGGFSYRVRDGERKNLRIGPYHLLERKRGTPAWGGYTNARVSKKTGPLCDESTANE